MKAKTKIKPPRKVKSNAAGKPRSQSGCTDTAHRPCRDVTDSHKSSNVRKPATSWQSVPSADRPVSHGGQLQVSAVATQCAPPFDKPATFSSRGEADRRFDEWQKKHRAVEEAILAGRDRRAQSIHKRRMRIAKAFGDLCEMTEGMAAFCRRTGMSLEDADKVLRKHRLPHPSLWLAWELGELAWSAISAIRKEITRRIARADHEAKRPFYYKRENERRRALAVERRKVRIRHTLSPCPTKEAVLDAWIHVKDSPEAMLRFGSLIEDLECYVDNSLSRADNGEIVGRRPGIKGWLQMEIPALYLKYTTVMAYKAAAKRMKQIIDMHDPIPLSVALADPAASKDSGEAKRAGNRGAKDATGVTTEGGAKFEDYGAEEIIGCGGKNVRGKGKNAKSGDNDWTDAGKRQKNRGDGGLRNGTDGVRPQLCEADELDAMRARAVYLEVMEPVGDGRRKQTALFARLKALTDPEAVEDANMLQCWKTEYERKITVRTKSVWMRKLKWTG